MSYYNGHNGLGQLDDGSGGGDPLGAIIGAVGSIVSGIVGGSGYDDQATSYRPPSDSANRFVCFNDSRGNYCVAYDATSQASLNKAVANGNRLDDVYSYYSVFITGGANAGESPAASRVITDYASNQKVSFQRAAEELLYICGLDQRVLPAIPGTTQIQPGAVPTAGGSTTPAPTPTPQPITLPSIPPPLTIPQPVAYTPQTVPTATSAPGATDNSWIWILLLVGGAIIISRK